MRKERRFQVPRALFELLVLRGKKKTTGTKENVDDPWMQITSGVTKAGRELTSGKTTPDRGERSR